MYKPPPYGQLDFFQGALDGFSVLFATLSSKVQIYWNYITLNYLIWLVTHVMWTNNINWTYKTNCFRNIKKQSRLKLCSKT